MLTPKHWWFDAWVSTLGIQMWNIIMFIPKLCPTLSNHKLELYRSKKISNLMLKTNRLSDFCWNQWSVLNSAVERPHRWWTKIHPMDEKVEKPIKSREAMSKILVVAIFLLSFFKNNTQKQKKKKWPQTSSFRFMIRIHGDVSACVPQENCSNVVQAAWASSWKQRDGCGPWKERCLKPTESYHKAIRP